MSQSSHPRPPQVTLAAWVTMLGSFFMVMSVWDVVSNLGSIETRESVQGTLNDPPLNGTNLGLESALEIMHVVALIAGACAAAAGILGLFVLRKDRSARIALSVVAIPLFLTGMVAGGFLSAMIAVSAVMLWSQPARDWFDGKAPRQPERSDRDRSGSEPGSNADSPDSGQRKPDPFATPPSSPTPGATTGTPPTGEAVDLPPPGPPAYSGFGEPAGGGTSLATAPQPTGMQPANPPSPLPSRSKAPRPVLFACILTWVMAGGAALLMLMVALVFAADTSVLREAYEQNDQIADSGMSLDEIREASLITAAVFGVWSLLAVGLAIFAILRKPWARIMLLISAGAAGGLTVVAATVSPLLILIAIGMLAAVWLLSRPESREWYAGK